MRPRVALELIPVTMLVLVRASFQAAASALHLQQVAYQGEEVTLSSGGDLSWDLEFIKWSVFFNETWIATLHGGKINTERFFLFRGRLALNASSGDLTIRNVSEKDTMDYRVELLGKGKRSLDRVVTLVVKSHLQKPSIWTLFTVHSDNGCWVGLHCWSQDVDANLSWTYEPSLWTAYNMFSPDSNAVVLLVSLPFRDIAHFTCTSSRNPEIVSDSIRVECLTTPTRQFRNRNGLFVLAGILISCIVLIVVLKSLKEVKKGSVNITAHQPDPPPKHWQGQDGEERRRAKDED